VGRRERTDERVGNHLPHGSRWRGYERGRGLIPSDVSVFSGHHRSRALLSAGEAASPRRRTS
jgi:hypothetical protein